MKSELWEVIIGWIAIIILGFHVVRWVMNSTPNDYLTIGLVIYGICYILGPIIGIILLAVIIAGVIRKLWS